MLRVCWMPHAGEERKIEIQSSPKKKKKKTLVHTYFEKNVFLYFFGVSRALISQRNCMFRLKHEQQHLLPSQLQVKRMPFLFSFAATTVVLSKKKKKESAASASRTKRTSQSTDTQTNKRRNKPDEKESGYICRVLTDLVSQLQRIASSPSFPPPPRSPQGVSLQQRKPHRVSNHTETS